MGLERRRAGLLRGASGTGPAAAWAVRAGEAGAGTSHPSRRGPTGGRRLDSRRRRQVGAGKGQEGQEFNVGCGGSGSDPGLRWSRLAEDGRLAPARRSTALPGLDYAQCASVGGTSTRDRTRLPKGVHPLLLLAPGVVRGGGSWERDTGRRSGSCSGQFRRTPHLTLTSESPGPGCGPGGRGGGGSWERDTRRRLGFGSDQLRAPPVRRAPRCQASGQHCRGPDRIAAHCEVEPGPRQRRASG